MKVLKTILASVFFISLIASCKKDRGDDGFVMEGKWSGKIGTGQVVPNGQYALNLKAGGVIERISSNGSVSATGTWSIAGKIFSANYTFSSGGTATITGTLKAEQSKMEGTWSNTGGEIGSWHVTKE